ncbi:MAG: regulatory protein RecX, partial [Owenweeksia sp.]
MGAQTDNRGKIYDLNEAREKISAYCAYRERSQVEVREKLYSYGLIPGVVDELIVELIQQNFLNEERFAR